MLGHDRHVEARPPSRRQQRRLDARRAARHRTGCRPSATCRIRPGWFYHASETARSRPRRSLLDIYYQSVGRGACLNLNLPPDRRGRIHENDVRVLGGFRRILDATFATDLARGRRRHGAATSAAATPQFAAANVLDGDATPTGRRTTRSRRRNWSSTLGSRDLQRREPARVPALGQRIEAFALDAWQDGAWREFAKGTTIGNRRLWRGEDVTTTRVRLRVTKAPVGPARSRSSRSTSSRPRRALVPRARRDASVSRGRRASSRSRPRPRPSSPGRGRPSAPFRACRPGW